MISVDYNVGLIYIRLLTWSHHWCFLRILATERKEAKGRWLIRVIRGWERRLISSGCCGRPQALMCWAWIERIDWLLLIDSVILYYHLLWGRWNQSQWNWILLLLLLPIDLRVDTGACPHQGIIGGLLIVHCTATRSQSHCRGQVTMDHHGATTLCRRFIEYHQLRWVLFHSHAASLL